MLLYVCCVCCVCACALTRAFAFLRAGSAFYLGGLLFSVAWGKVSDRYGRRPVMLCGVMGTVVSLMAFGFSFSFSFAVVVRFVWGSWNGNVGVAKTVRICCMA